MDRDLTSSSDRMVRMSRRIRRVRVAAAWLGVISGLIAGSVAPTAIASSSTPNGTTRTSTGPGTGTSPGGGPGTGVGDTRTLKKIDRSKPAI
jgi:hypothetical protein